MSLNLLNGHREALELLDWFSLTEALVSLAHFEKSKSRLAAPPVARKVAEIEADLSLLDSFLQHYEDYTVYFNSQLRLLPESETSFQLIKDISKGKFFSPKELHFFSQLAETYTKNFTLFDSVAQDLAPEVPRDQWQKIERQFVLPLRQFVDPSGNTNYERHPLLKKLYQEVLTLENDLRTSVQKLSRTEPYHSRLQIDTYDIINDRYVLAIRSDSFNAELGAIIARSQSGMTLFVEPYEIREMSNRRIFVLSEIEATLMRLTIDLSKEIHPKAELFDHMAQWVLELDWLHTKATYTRKLHLTRPILSPSFHFEFQGLFHPLIAHPVKNNLHLDRSHKGLVISGPNTGGKTVALKSLCLSILFVHLGLYVPASKAELYPVEHLFYFSHDHQNLIEGLSSFASEAKYYLNLLSEFGEKNLIVIDEIFNSTSSEEASALAIALLEEIHQMTKAKIIISTHHQVLKTFMHSRSDYISAHVGFDFESNRPTYKLILGEPGSSLAFKIFDNLSSHFGLQTQISQNAKALLDQKQVTYESLLQELSHKKIELDKLLSSNRQLQLELKNQKSSMEGLLFLEREKILNEYSKKIQHTFLMAEKILDEAKKGEIENRRQLNNKALFVQKELNEHRETGQPYVLSHDVYSHLKPIAFEDIKMGMTLFSVVMKKNIKVVQINARKREVQIQNGALSVWVGSESLRWPSGAKIPVAKVHVNIERTVRGDIEIDCRGMRLEEFQKTCEQAIEEVFSGEIPFVTIIHGHGDGILKNWLRSYLKKEYRELRFENIEGNDGCTKIFI